MMETTTGTRTTPACAMRAGRHDPPPAMGPPPAGGLWSVETAARYLDMTEDALRGMLKRQGVPPDCVLRLGRRVRFRADRLREWVEKLGERAKDSQPRLTP